MLCQNCKKTDATVHWMQVYNHTKTQKHLCEVCAQKLGVDNPLADLPEVFGKIVANIIGEEIQGALPRKKRSRKRNQRRCEACGATLDDVEHKGLIGCAHCYQTFETEIAALLRRLQGSSEHRGSQPATRHNRPVRVNLQKLRHELRDAVAAENYERAAELRNQIVAAEKSDKTPNQNGSSSAQHEK